MRNEESEGVGTELVDEDERAEARSVRLPFCTWRGLLVFVVAMAAGAAMVGEEPDAAGEVKADVALAGHSGLVDTLRFSRDGRTLVSSGWDRTVRVWGLDDEGAGFGEELARLSTGGENYAAGISPDGRTVAVVGIDGLTLWDWEGDGPTRTSSEPIGISRSLAFSPDGRLLAVGGVDDVIRLVDVATGRVEAALAGHRDVLRKLAFTADSRGLFSLSYDGRLKFWDLASRRETPTLPGLEDEERPVLMFALSRDGDSLALSRLHEKEGRVEIWDATGGGLRATCRGSKGEVHALAFSQDGSVLASCGSDLFVRFWNPKTGNVAGVLDGDTGWVRTLDFSADGRWMAISSFPDEVRLRRIDLPHRQAATAGTRPSHVEAGAA